MSLRDRIKKRRARQRPAIAAFLRDKLRQQPCESEDVLLALEAWQDSNPPEENETAEEYGMRAAEGIMASDMSSKFVDLAVTLLAKVLVEMIKSFF